MVSYSFERIGKLLEERELQKTGAKRDGGRCDEPGKAPASLRGSGQAEGGRYNGESKIDKWWGAR